MELDYYMNWHTKLTKNSSSVLTRSSKENLNVTRNDSLAKEKFKKQLEKKCCYSESVTNKISEFCHESTSFENGLSFNKEYCHVSHLGIDFNYCKMVGENTIGTNKNNISKLNLDLYSGMVKKDNLFVEQTVPPLLNDDTNYIRVSSKETDKREDIVDYYQHCKKTVLPVLSGNKDYNKKCITHPEKEVCTPKNCSFNKSGLLKNNPIPKLDNVNQNGEETFKVLISGHLTQETPVFIVHKNNVDLNTSFEACHDFRTHKRFRNIDVSLTGKFFKDNLLIEDKTGGCYALDMKSHKIPIGKESVVSQEKFKHILNLGMFKAVIEGEFVSDSGTLDCVPVFSLEVVKNEVCEKVNSDGSTIKQEENDIRTEQIKSVLAGNENEHVVCTERKQKHEHCSKIQENNTSDHSKALKLKKVKRNSKENAFTKLMECKFIKQFFNHKRNKSDQKKLSQSTNGVGQTKKNKQENKSRNKIQCKKNYRYPTTVDETIVDHRRNQNAILETIEENSKEGLLGSATR